MTPTERRLDQHVRRLGEEHPPIALDSVDYSVRRPEVVRERFGHVLDYMARVELEVDRNVLELTTLLPDPPAVDVFFYADVWQPQEIRHGLILDELQTRLGRPPAVTDVDSVSAKLKVLGALARHRGFQDVCRMMYYLTGMSTERSAVLAYNHLSDGLAALDEPALVETVVGQIKRQEPGHYAFYQISARGLWAELAPWQRWLVRRLRSVHYAPVGANSPEQTADFGDVMIALGIDNAAELDGFTASIVRVEAELLWEARGGLPVPAYVVDAFREAIDSARARASVAAG